VNFLFDNNLPAPLADALRLLNKSVVHVRGISELGAAAPDDLILDYAAAWDYTVVTRDRAMRKSPHFQALLHARKVGAVFVNTGNARQLNTWQIAQLIIRAWDEIEQFAESNARPFLALVQKNARVIKL
jgi:predicted nuclease of predicted toxin-antitoxin system